MDLGSVFSRVSGGFGKNQVKNESFLAVKLSFNSVVAVVWTIEEGKVLLNEPGKEPITKKDWGGLLEAADKAISEASQSDPDVEKAIFAVPFAWVSEGKIKPEHLKDLRRLCKELSLTPQGFVVLTEALENYYKEVEGAPLTAILVGIDGTDSNLTMYRAGKNLGTVPLPLEDMSAGQVPIAMEKALKRFTGSEVFPSRIILYNSGSDLEEAAERITAFPWTKQLPFLHFPKVEIAAAEMVTRAVAVAGGTQMGGKIDINETEEIANEQTIEGQEHEAKQIAEQMEVEEISAEEAGFTFGADAGSISIPVAKTAEVVQEEIPEPFGQLKEMEAEVPPKLKEETVPVTVRLKEEARKLKSLLGRIKFPGKSRLLIPGVLAILALVLFAVGGIAFFLPQATVIVHVTPEMFNKDLLVTVVTDSSKITATSSAILVGSFVDVSEADTKRGIATGKKLVGDKAKGTITIVNSAGAHDFTTGTALSSGGLKFLTNSAISVASSSGLASLTTATVDVTASDIGDNYNLSANTLFTIDSLPTSSYQGKNDSAFTGGNSHQATVVTADDQNRLLATLSGELTGKARNDLQAKIGNDQKLLPNAMTATVTKKNFSKDVNLEADTVTLDLAMSFRGVVFIGSDLVNLFIKTFPDTVPTGYELSPESIQINVQNAKTDKSGNAVLGINLQAKSLPKLDTGDLISKLSGKSPAAAKTFLMGLPGVSDVSLDAQPKILGSIINFALPWRKQNIKLDIVSD